MQKPLAKSISMNSFSEILLPWHAREQRRRKRRRSKEENVENGKVFAWNGTLHVFYENELKMIIFSIFKFVFTFPNISYNFLIFSNRMNFPERILHSFSRSNWNQLYFLTPLSGKHSQMKIDRSWKRTERTSCTHTHTLLKEFFILHTNCYCL